MSNWVVVLPSEMSHKFFFPIEEIEWKESYSNEFQLKIPFIHEIGYYTGIKGINPWEIPEIVIPALMDEWKNVKGLLEAKFEKRESPNLSLLKGAIALFLEFLFWSNERPVCFPLNDLKMLKVKPVNIDDRLNFIISRPTLYQSFSQLVQLMIEQEKHYSKFRQLNKLTKQENVRG